MKLVTDSFARQVLELSPDPMIIVDDEGIVIYASSRVRNVFGYLPEELVGNEIETLLPERFHKIHPRHRERIISGAAQARVNMSTNPNLVGLHKSGREVPVEISLNRIEADGDVYVLSVIRDMSDARRLEQELRLANRSMTRFLGAASHDLRQPIQTLNLLNRALLSLEEDPRRIEIIQSQQKNLDYLARQLGALLDVTKLEAGAVDPDLEPHNLETFLDALSSRYAIQAEEKGLSLSVEYTDCSVVTDFDLAMQVLENLVSNAIKYTSEGGITIKSAVVGDYVNVSITDTGAGIEEGELEDIFNEFHQLENSKETSGVGLGLAIVKRIADLLGLSVDVESVVGSGTSFHVRLPLDRASSSTLPVDEADALDTNPEASKLILVVDDEVDIVEATILMLELEGYTCVSATSLASVDEAIHSAPRAPDLILADFRLKNRETGVDVIERVRKAHKSMIPAIIVSGDLVLSKGAPSVPSTLYHSKPVDIELLLEQIETSIQKSGEDELSLWAI